MRLLGEEVLKEEGGGGPAIVIDNRDGADGKTYTPPSWKEQRWDEQRRWGGGMLCLFVAMFVFHQAPPKGMAAFMFAMAKTVGLPTETKPTPAVVEVVRKIMPGQL